MFRPIPAKRLLLAGLAICFVAINARAQSINPLEGDMAAARAGGALFRAQCATCHGADGKGISTISAPDLTLVWSQGGRSDNDVFNIIRNGVSGTIMPPHSYNDTQTWMLVTFLRSIGVRGAGTLPPGDGRLGRQAFNDNCARCHRVGNLGGSLGPNLSNLLTRRSLEYIETSVRDPDSFIVPGYHTVRVRLANNESYEGVLMNEDAFSVQMIDSNQQLQSFQKNELVAFDKPPRSLMPAFPEPALRLQILMDILHFIQNP